MPAMPTKISSNITAVAARLVVLGASAGTGMIEALGEALGLVLGVASGDVLGEAVGVALALATLGDALGSILTLVATTLGVGLGDGFGVTVLPLFPVPVAEPPVPVEYEIRAGAGLAHCELVTFRGLRHWL